MKLLFWILAVLSIPVGLFISIVSWFAEGLGLSGTGIGVVVCFAGMFSVVVSIVCAVLGIIKLRKGHVKKAVTFAVVAVAYPAVILAGMCIDDAVHGVLMERDIANRNEQIYGENWDAPPAIEGVPEFYQEVLNKFYVAVRDEWSGDQMIGTTAPVEEGGTAIFCMYSDPECPHDTLNGVQGELYYLHPGEGGTYVAEIGGSYMPEVGDTKGYWLLGAYEDERIVDIMHQEGSMDPTGRLTLDMIPFSQYK